jgi:hypothetical protein
LKPFLLSVLLTFCAIGSSFGQSIKGQIFDTEGKEIPFAKIRVENTSYGTVANALGKYVLELKQGNYTLQITAPGFITLIDSIVVHENFTNKDFTLATIVQEIEEVTIIARSKKERGKEIMKMVIDKRSFFYDQVPEYSCDTYCLSSLEKEVRDTIFKDSVVGKEKMNLIEWGAITSYKKSAKFKDEFYAYEDFTDIGETMAVASASVTFGDGAESIAPVSGEGGNPYLFITGIKDAHINLFENLLELPKISEKPLTSPLAYNALLYYNFYLEGSFYDEENTLVYEIRVDPRFDYEPLFKGTIFVRDSTWELTSYELSINPSALTYFEELHLICDYSTVEGKLVPTRREFVYNIKEGKTKINGLIRLTHDKYSFKVNDDKRNFWLETKVYSDDAFDKDSTFWSEKRPFTLKELELNFIRTQDSSITYHETDEYMRTNDSIRNRIKFTTVVFEGVRHVNSFKKQEWRIAGLVEQVIPFGVGGYRHRLGGYYKKGFENRKSFTVRPMIDYGFRNKDVKGSFGGSFLYNPKRFSEVDFEVGDVYDFVSNVQNIQGTFAPGNRVRNKKFEISHRMELFNGLYGKLGVEFSDRTSITNLEQPKWDTLFGIFADPIPFDPYRILLANVDLEYHFRQKYMIRKGKKIVLGSPYPTLFFKYKRGIPNVFNSQSNFDFVEFRIHDDVQLNTFGTSELNFTMGGFVFKKDLRVIEHKFFRPSDQGFFSNPVNTLQILDTALSTNKSYMQFNFIHHFKGFFLNKIWLINRLKLEETIGGGFLTIPDAKFGHVEFYAGLERKLRIRQTIFKIGIYAVAGDSNFTKADLNFKFGFNFYDNFTGKWQY